MQKSEMLPIIKKAAKIYNECLNGQNLLIVTGSFDDKTLSFSNPSFIETIATNNKFLHLTGVVLNNGLRPEDFFERALDGTLEASDFEIKDSTTEMKMEVIERALNTHQFKMSGTYAHTRPNLHTDILIGGERSSVGFIKVGEKYVPNTLLKGDVRKDVNGKSGVLMILSKRIGCQEYNKVAYAANKVYFHKLVDKIKAQFPEVKIDVDYDSELTKQQLNRDAAYAVQEQEMALNSKIQALLKAIDNARKSVVETNDSTIYERLIEQLVNTLPNQKKCREVLAHIEQQKATASKDEKPFLSYEEDCINEIIANLDRQDIEPRKLTIQISPKNPNFQNNQFATINAGAVSMNAAQANAITITIPPKRPFKAIWVKVKTAIENHLKKPSQNSEKHTKSRSQPSPSKQKSFYSHESSVSQEARQASQKRSTDLEAPIHSGHASPPQFRLEQEQEPHTAHVPERSGEATAKAHKQRLKTKGTEYDD